ncbi:MAG: AbrB/MazE/SpoVT family DNA-binding domain-containing protein [Spirochaetota bacterium]
MKTRITRIGNSRGIRIPKTVLDLYGLTEGDQLELSETRDGILLRPPEGAVSKLSWAKAYEEMASEAAERAEWADWDGVVGDGLDD